MSDATESTGHPGLLDAVSVLNAGDFKGAVDAFEVPYHEGDEAHRELHLGLVRAAACLHHVSKGNTASARRLRESAMALLVRFTPVAAGLRIDRLLADLERLDVSRAGVAPAVRIELA